MGIVARSRGQQRSWKWTQTLLIKKATVRISITYCVAWSFVSPSPCMACCTSTSIALTSILLCWEQKSANWTGSWRRNGLVCCRILSTNKLHISCYSFQWKNCINPCKTWVPNTKMVTTKQGAPSSRHHKQKKKPTARAKSDQPLELMKGTIFGSMVMV